MSEQYVPAVTDGAAAIPTSAVSAVPQVEVAVDTDSEPAVIDTYALVYAFTLAFLVPGAIYIESLAFRTYTFAYVGAIAFPFVLGLVLTLITDTRDAVKLVLKRMLVLIPMIVLTGVGVLFISALSVVPASVFIKPQYFDVLGPVAVGLMVLVALPLLFAVWKRVRKRIDWRSALQLVVLFFAVAVVVYVAGMSLRSGRELIALARKDVVIYIVGGLSWYLPSFAISAGVWRRIGVV